MHCLSLDLNIFVLSLLESTMIYLSRGSLKQRSLEIPLTLVRILPIKHYSLDYKFPRVVINSCLIDSRCPVHLWLPLTIRLACKLVHLNCHSCRSISGVMVAWSKVMVDSLVLLLPLLHRGPRPIPREVHRELGGDLMMTTNPMAAAVIARAIEMAVSHKHPVHLQIRLRACPPNGERALCGSSASYKNCTMKSPS